MGWTAFAIEWRLRLVLAWRWAREHIVALLTGLAVVLSLGLAHRWLNRPPKKSERPLPVPQRDYLAEAYREAMRVRADRARAEAEAHMRAANAARQAAEDQRTRVESADVDELVDMIRRDEAATRRRKNGLTFLLPIAVLTVHLVAQPVYAAAPGQSDDAPSTFKLAHPRTGELGIWMPEDYARAVFADHLAVPKLTLEISQLRLSVNAQRVAIDAGNVALDASTKAVSGLTAGLSACEARTQAVERQRDALWHSPRLWVPVALTTLLVGMGLGFAAGAH